MTYQRQTRSYNDYIVNKRAQHGERFSPVDLAPQFIPYYENQTRVRVRFAHGGPDLTGTIGVTTGWRPCFLLMRTSRAVGSSCTLGTKDAIVAVKRGLVYVSVDGGTI